ncbi:hypothetical protein [Kiritimatiella glycovorans]|uniref:Uncharacterized protein n=1 Tax=Kiritimatiella glycovorans TaxID=1307763 RepID=A0A0G3EGP1_9BACT|nr:hypothetical protein [Kiritimatiella glycovorans]AKJ64592.1 hypothetical protein L21SP4_01344 [Kiritimatiella glycovorans]
MDRRDFMQRHIGGAGAVLSLGMLRARQVRAAELGVRPDSFPLSPGAKTPPEELRMLAGYIEAFSPPEGRMDDAGGWTAVYDMLRFSATPGYRKQRARSPMSNVIFGQVAVTRAHGSTDCDVRMIFEPAGVPEEVRARIACREDRPASVRSYELDWTCSHTKPKAGYTRRERGTASPGVLKVESDGHTDRFEHRHPLTCPWTLFDAVRRFPADPGREVPMDMMMDLS